METITKENSRMVGNRARNKVGHRKREAAAAGSLTCPVCKKTFAKGNQLRFHYDEEHSVRDPSIATSICYKCGDCKQYFARREQVKKHECAAKARDRRVLWKRLSRWGVSEKPDTWDFA